MKQQHQNRYGRLLSAFGLALAIGFVPVSSRAIDPDSDDPPKPKVGATDPENTGINERDRNGAQVTAFDQGNSEADRNLTASVRKVLVEDDSLSMNAHNVKIITIGGVVTLRGPVDSAAEKGVVEKKAKSVAGVASVNSQLEVDHD